MAISYTTSGKAFLGAACLGYITLYLCGLHDEQGRVARGAILFADDLDIGVSRRRITIVPGNGDEAFDVVVTGIYDGCVAVASCGTMPWWQ